MARELFRIAANGPQVAEGGYTQTLKRSTDMENTTNIPSEDQTGRFQQPAVGGSVCRITPAQAESIYMVKEDIKAMLGGGDDDREWRRNVRNIERFLKANGFSF